MNLFWLHGSCFLLPVEEEEEKDVKPHLMRGPIHADGNNINVSTTIYPVDLAAWRFSDGLCSG
jgi:hypothetical protein